MENALKVDGGSKLALLRAYPMKRWLPKLGSGLNMFEAPMQAAGNMKLRVKANVPHFAAKA
ncbi:MAG: hypothetical protein HZB29_00115 [Nitrospinae bacterium]|nr:hypothetical protein [Nitrospinota bacterium]